SGRPIRLPAATPAPPASSPRRPARIQSSGRASIRSSRSSSAGWPSSTATAASAPSASAGSRARSTSSSRSERSPRQSETGFPLARDQARPADVVTADVHQRATLEVGAQPDVRLVVEAVAERRPHEPELADGALAHQLYESRGLRMVAVHEGLHQEAAGALCG